MANGLEVGAGGPVSASPRDQQANPPGVALPQPGPSPMMGHFGSKLDQTAAQFQKMKESNEQLQAIRAGLDKLATLGDTVTMDDVVDEASGLIAAGIPAAQVASTLADVPEGSPQIQAWVKEQSQKLLPSEQKVQGALAQTGYELGHHAMKHIIAASAEQHHQRLRLAAAQPQGRA